MFGVVVDTNILVRAFLSGKREEDEILKKIRGGNYWWVYGKEQLKEFVEVVGYERVSKKYFIDMEKLRRFCQWVAENAGEIEPMMVDLCRDPDDNYVIGLAVGAVKRHEVYLVTGDKDILDLKGKIERVEIVTPGEFLKQVARGLELR